MASNQRLVMKISFERSRYTLTVPFRISREIQTEVQVLTVTLVADGHRGRGETVGVNYRGETLDSIERQLEGLLPRIESSVGRHEIQQLLPAGGARNALDAALWDLESKSCGIPVWQLAQRTAPGPVPMTVTLSLDTPERMAAAARCARHYSALKLKLGADDDDVARVEAVRAAAPDAVLLCDVNEGWDFDQLRRYVPELRRLGMRLIEQPLKAGQDKDLQGFQSPVALCADESCFDRSDLATVRRRYSAINIKLEKTGGLTEALALAGEAKSMGLQIMVGCMVSTSLSIAPALLLRGDGLWFDLDGPTYLTADRFPGIEYCDGTALPPPQELWG